MTGLWAEGQAVGARIAAGGALMIVNDSVRYGGKYRRNPLRFNGSILAAAPTTPVWDTNLGLGENLLEGAACASAQADPRWWDSDRPKGTKALAQETCARCPVKGRCADNIEPRETL